MNRKQFLKLGCLSMAALAGRPVAAAPAARRWAMVVDAKKCLKEKGCDRCIQACHRVHNVPEFPNRAHEIKWIWKEPFQEAFPSERGPYVNEIFRDQPFLVFCNHCDNPPCVRVCPTQATWKRDDGIVMMDWHRCIGCRYCMAACPYGSRSFNWLDPRPHIARIDPDYPTRTKGVVEKCTFCEERLARQLAPACMEACAEKVLVFGDLEDAGSAVRELLRTNFAIRRKAELGTVPEIYYIV